MKKWEKDKKYSTIQYLNNIAIRTAFSKTHDLVLISDLVYNYNERFKIGCKFCVKGFIFIDTNMVHPGEIKVNGRVYAKLNQEKNAPWVDYNNSTPATRINNQINSDVINFLKENSITDDEECVEYMNTWKKYLDSRNYVLQENERQKLELTSVNLQIATFCDNCNDDIRSHYESIPYIRVPREKRQGWFINHVDENHCRKVLLLHICKEYGNRCYQRYIDKTDLSFKKEFDQFTRDGLKLFGDRDLNEGEYDKKENEIEERRPRDENCILDTYDSRISSTFVEILNPIIKIKTLEEQYSERRAAKEKELARKRDEALDSAQKEYRSSTLKLKIREFENELAISKSDLESFAKENGIELGNSNKDEVESRLRKELISKETIRLIESNYVLLKNKFDIQYTNALSDFDSIESQEFNEEKESIIKENSTLRLHAYFDLSDDYDVSDEIRVKSLNDTISKITHPYVKRNLDGDRVLLRRQSEGIKNLMEGYVMNPFLTTFLFNPQYGSNSDIITNDETDFFQNLNSSQRKTIIRAISSHGLYLIQGPPGTGKTQTIAEITTQLAKSGKKVLIASQNNKAVDTAFSRLPKMPYIRPVRVLRDSRDNQYSYDNLTDNLYKNIIGSLKRQIKKNSDEHKYVNESKLLIERLTIMRDSIEKIESQLGDLERDIEDHENNRAHYQSELAIIHQEIVELEHNQDHFNNLSNSLVSGQFDNYLSLIDNWPEGLSSIPDEQRESFLKSLIQISEDDFMDALTDPDSIEDPELEISESELNHSPELSIAEVVEIINNNYPDIIEAFETYQALVEQILEESKKLDKKSLLYSKKITSLRRTEKQLNDKLITEDKYILELKKDDHYQTILKERSNFNKELAVCFSELEIEAELDQESAIEVIRRTVESVKRKLGDKESNLEGRIVAYQRIVDYLSDNDVLNADRSRINDAILKYVNVIGITCSKASSSARIKYMSNDEEQNLKLNSLNIDVVILDETSKIPFSELVPPILYGKTVVLVGDHRQLPPVYSEIKKDDFNLYDPSKINLEDEELYREMYTNSFFGKLFQATPNNCKSTLTIQYRMHPQIMDLVNTFYPDTPLEFGGRLFDKEHHMLIEGAYGQILNPEKHVLFINCNGHEKRESGTMSSYNPQEAEAVVRLLDLLNDNCHLDRNGDPIDDSSNDCDNRLSLGVICPYKGQVNRIKDLKKASYRSFNESSDERFMISTVDNFQGDERDVIVLSMVRTEQCDWLSEYRRINVAISRARRLLIIVGNEYGLSNIDVIIETTKGPIIKKAYREIIKKISESGCRLDSGDIIGVI